MENSRAQQEQIEEEKQRKLRLALAQIEMKMEAHKKKKEEKWWVGILSRICTVGAALMFFLEMFLISRVNTEAPAAGTPAGGAAQASSPQLPAILSVGALFILLILASVIFAFLRRVR